MRVFFLASEAHQAVKIEKLVFQGALRHHGHKLGAILVGGVEGLESSPGLLPNCLPLHTFRIHLYINYYLQLILESKII
jgi:hypothetical protein